MFKLSRMNESIKVFSPATVANVGSGFDILGFALGNRGDIIEALPNNEKRLAEQIKSGGMQQQSKREKPR